MKFPNYLKNAFAGLGVVSLFFYTCAAADEIASDNNDNNPPSMSSGVYEHSLDNINGYSRMTVLNTETGVIKTYGLYNSGTWSEIEAATIQVTH